MNAQTMIEIAERLPEIASNGLRDGCEVWYGDNSTQYRVEYDLSGRAVLVQRVGELTTYRATTPRYTFDSTGRLPERDTIAEAAADWGDDLPTVVHWTEYGADDRPIAQGTTAIEAPYGTVEHWRE